jgi:hypothetical protein
VYGASSSVAAAEYEALLVATEAPLSREMPAEYIYVDSSINLRLLSLHACRELVTNLRPRRIPLKSGFDIS